MGDRCALALSFDFYRVWNRDLPPHSPENSYLAARESTYHGLIKNWTGSRNWYSIIQLSGYVCILLKSQLHFSGKLFAHRACAKFSIFGNKLHDCPVIYFLTDPKNIFPLESYETSKLENICFGNQM